ncbi:MAG: acyl-CoA dehydrogenase family protein [Burkholderiales bacterium]
MSDERTLIADSVNRLFADTIDRALLERIEAGEWPAALWAQVEEGGFDQVLCLEGAAHNWLDAQSVLRAIGYYRVPLPLAECIVGNWLLARAGLPVDSGPISIVQCDNAMRLSKVGDRLVLNGTLVRVPWGRQVKRIVVAGVLAGRPVIAIVDPSKAGTGRITADVNVAAEPRDSIVCEGSECEAYAFVDALGSDPVRTYGALARAATMGGAIESVLDQAVQYANDRIQFGRPIGKFQAVQHLLAELGSESAAATAAITGGCESVSALHARLDIAAAKVRAGEAAKHAARIAHQVHGAIGFTYEHTLHFATRRLWSWRNELGNDAYWARELGAAIIQSGGARFWAEMTAR